VTTKLEDIYLTHEDLQNDRCANRTEFWVSKDLMISGVAFFATHFFFQFVDERWKNEKCVTDALEGRCELLRKHEEFLAVKKDF